MDPPRAAFERAAPTGQGSAGTARGAGSEEGTLAVVEGQSTRVHAQMCTQVQQPEAFPEISAEVAVLEAEVAESAVDILPVVELLQRRNVPGGGSAKVVELGQAAAMRQKWCESEGDREKVWRMLGELQYWWDRQGREVRWVDCPELADCAESFKNGMMQLRPRTRRAWDAVLGKNPAFWNRISLHHLRMAGKRHWYAIVHSLDEAHRLLVLKIPPVKFVSEDARVEHAKRQMTYRDDERGRFAAGLRVSDEFMELLDADDFESHGRFYMSGGHHMDLVEVPQSYSRENYKSYEEHADRSLQDLRRQEDAGWIEGPLHYRPRIINAQAGILKGDKYRPVMDARRSGLNAAIRPSDCSYDMLSDFVQVLERGDRHGAFDFKDAFYMWPRENRFCDYQGLQGPKGSPGVYRMRFMTMGTTDSPGIQQGWARIVKKVVNEKVLRPLGEQHVLENGLEMEPLQLQSAGAEQEQLAREMEFGGVEETLDVKSRSVSQFSPLRPPVCHAGVPVRSCDGAPEGGARLEERRGLDGLEAACGAEVPVALSRREGAAPSARPAERRLVGGGSAAARVAAMYVDDGKTHHAACFTKQQADAQFGAALAFFDQYGLEYSAKKNVWPSEQGEYLGVGLDTEDCVATVTAEKAAKYGRAIRELLEERRRCGDVGRRALASVVGKLMFASDVVPGLRALLAPCYWALQEFVERPEEGCEWEQWVRVHLSAEAVRALEAAAALLDQPGRLRRRFYPNRDPQLAGFWKGVVRDSHGEMDETHRAAEGVVVITGDASGDQGAAVTVVRPEEGERRAVWRYGPEDSAPRQSSNWRELDTVVRPLEMWGAELAGQRVLVRTDNTTAKSVVNNRGTVSANLQPLCARLVEVCRAHDLDVAAMHIPGVENTLADALSRFKRGMDKGDWMLARRAFGHAQQVVREEYAVEFTLDGSSDPVGSNRQLPRFCSAVNSLLRRRLEGEHLYCNPDFELIERVLRHFLEAYRRAEVATSGTFVLPVWADRSWWRLLRGARVVAYYPAGTPLFTSPDWRQLAVGQGQYSLVEDGGRAYRGPTRWPVLVAHFPPVLAHRRGGAGAVGAARGGRAGGGRLPALRGEAASDLRMLSAVRPCAVY